MSGLRLEGLSKRYGRIDALRDVDLSVGTDELLAVLGPSGCGKTTLLRLIAGLEEPTGGRVLLDGRDITGLPPGRRNVSMVFQSHALFPHMTVRENIAFGLIVRDVPRADAAARVERAVGLVGCGNVLERRPHELSGGERQRVALARSLVREPDVFLFDEPLSNLDAELRVQMRAELKELHRRVGGVSVHVTHDQVEALVLGDRIAVLREGRVEQHGTPDEIWREPVNRFVARFVGSPTMNVVPADGPLRVQGVPADPGLELGVRPEHLRLGHGPARGSVALVEPVGSEAYVHVDVAGVRLVARCDSAGRPQPGDQVLLSAVPDHVHLFDAATGARVRRR
ncbi:MAG TPA: ABC transporter ATP-binding protein [Gaiella sp.]|uniref:ABC transporter ATP-binding protein n=1 Tax=Gaiella sp. TaxID=2663207 RepID=UPI002D7F4A2C|nr:ABC transporter ATP-binding protein [Gaiella sp.]HET9288400.1 ABC transporter ATP-binding protein [Gaiella sp.]